MSIVIPVLNEAAALPGLLTALTSWRTVAEIIVVDGGSTDQTTAVAAANGCLLVHSARGRAKQQNAGALQAKGRHILFLHADSQPSIAVGDFLRALDDDPVWGFFNVRLSGADWRFRIIERFMCWRSRWTRIATGDQCLFVERARFAKLGGFADIPLMEDIELSKRLRQQAPPRVIADPVVTSSRRWEQRGILRTVALMWSLRLRYWLGESPASLHQRYYPE
ncbi:MAG: TIGR04283 family arsenosugar biosynthesis glycosyltransferase [Pseudomonadota bacterium]